MWTFDQGHSYEQLSLMPQQHVATNTVSQQGSQRQEQTGRLYWHIAQRAAVKMFDALYTLNTKHSDFNQIFVNLLSGEPINTE